MKAQTNTSPGFDQLIIGLGEAIHYLVDEHNRLLKKTESPSTEEARQWAWSQSGDVFHRIHALQCAVAAVPATDMKAAAIQVRTLSHMNIGDADDEDGPSRKRLLYSVLGVLEAKGGVRRSQWGGNFCIPLALSPFNLSLDYDKAVATWREAEEAAEEVCDEN